MNRMVLFFILITIKIIKCENDTPKVTALVLARGGSKGIPLKNLVEINGISLLGRALLTINKTNIFDNIWVSTDHNKIALEALKYYATVHNRSDDLSQDTTSSIAVVENFLTTNPNIENIALIQCTSIFLKEKYLQKAIDLFKDSDCVFAASRSHKLRWKYNKNNKKYETINFDKTKRPRRQDWDGELIETGMFYFSKRKLILNGYFQNDNCKIVEIDTNDAHEIDTFSDLELARCLIDKN